MTLTRALDPIVDLVFPPRCPLCGEALAAQNGLCAACWGSLALPGDPACALCQTPLADPRAICAPCEEAPPAHHGIAAATIYNPASRQLVLGLKHGRRLALAPLLARLIVRALGALPQQPDAGWLVVPVPLHRWRLWHRGYNQSALLAREVARLTGARLCVDALVRRRHTRMLRGLDGPQRRAMLAGAIAAHPRRRGRLAGASVLLIDDVLTSGATSDACIAALTEAGAQRVAIGCFARVLSGELV